AGGIGDILHRRIGDALGIEDALRRANDAAACFLCLGLCPAHAHSSTKGPPCRRAPRRHSPGVAAVPAVSSAGRRLIRPKSFITKTKKTGTKNTASTVAEIIPPITPVPIARWLPELAPVAIASGRTPSVKA